MSSLNPRLLTVGMGGTADFDKIQDAINAIGSSPMYPPATPDSRYTIFVTPGTYKEKIAFKDGFVDLVGIDQHAVQIQPETTWRDKVIIQLVSDVTVNNVTVWNHNNQYAIFGRDVRRVGLNRVEVWARYIANNTLSTAKALRIEGNWSTFITRFFGASYYGTDGYSVELIGPDPLTPDRIDTRRGPEHPFTDIGWNADCHLINSFFDSLRVGDLSSGGCVYVKDCHEVHLRNSLVRTTGLGSAVLIEATDPAKSRLVYTNALPYMDVGESAPLVAVTIQASTLNGPNRALHIGNFCICFFRNSSADSITLDTGLQHMARGRLLDRGWRRTRELLELG
jgi:hypothetical protein